MSISSYTGLLVTVAPQLVKRFGSRAFAALTDIAGLYGARLSVIGGIITVGVIAYFIKQYNQRLYGVVEALFGASAVAAVALGISPLSPTPAQWATLVGSGYVIARGLNNVADARRGISKGFRESLGQLKNHA